MFSEVTLDFKVAIPTKDLENKGLIHKRNLLATRLLKNLLNIKSTEKHGYFLTVTSFKCTGKGKTDESHSCLTLFPINFTCRAFTPCVGETMLGVVYGVNEYGAMLRCGPMRLIFLSIQKMAGLRCFVTGKKAAYLNNNFSRIEVDVVVRFRVFAVKWVEKEYKTKREFKVLASLEGDSLGPVSLSGSDELDLL